MKEKHIEYLELLRYLVNRGIRQNTAYKIIDKLVDRFDYLDEDELMEKFNDCFIGTFISKYHYYIEKASESTTLVASMVQEEGEKITVIYGIHPVTGNSLVYILDFNK